MSSKATKCKVYMLAHIHDTKKQRNKQMETDTQTDRQLSALSVEWQELLAPEDGSSALLH